jgi:3-oxoacyl-[acyl-carrier-protein] synthase-3
MASRVTDVYLNAITSTRGSVIESNDAATLGQPEQDCERIAAKIGIRSRPIASADEYTSDLALRASELLLPVANGFREEIDALVVCTQTPDHLIPGVSSVLHGKLGLSTSCFVMDMNQGCSGFIYGAQMLGALIKSGMSQRAVLVNADCYSRLIRPDDLTTRVLFGDAAAAGMFSTTPGGLKLLYSKCYSDGSGYEEFIARNSGVRQDVNVRSGIFMNGPGILNFALRVVPEAIEAALGETGLALDQIRTIAFHQANSFIIGKLAHKLRLRVDQVPQNCETLGNTVSASIPILLQSEMANLRSGDLVMAVGFGVGLSWGVAVFENTVAS